MTSTPIVERLAKEFSIQPEHVKSTLEMIDAGLAAPFIGRVRREATGGLSEGVVRKLERRRFELDRRRGTILRILGVAPRPEPEAEKQDPPGSAAAPDAASGTGAPDAPAAVEPAAPEASTAAGSAASEGVAPGPEPADAGAAPEAPAEGARAVPAAGSEPTTKPEGPRAPAAVIERVKTCMDRFELEDLFLPHRRPEPEVQLALDRGLGALADRLVATAPPERRAQVEAPEPKPAEQPASAEEGGEGAVEPAAASESDATSTEPSEAAEATAAPEAAAATEGPGEAGPEASTPQEPATEDPATRDAATADPATEKPATEEPATPESDAPAAPAEQAPAQVSAKGGATDEVSAAEAAEKAALDALLHGQIELTPELARICADYVSPDRGIHTESDALAGAMRILSDRLGRDTRLRGQIRKLLRKQGVLTVRAMVDEKRLGRHKKLLKVKQPLRQIQGHKLLAIRQAQKERAVTTAITLDRKLALPKVRAALGKHTDVAYAGVLDAIALRTLEHRLLPLLEADVRLELKERADEEALRFLSQHLRQVLLTPALGRRPAAGLDVNAKGDWTVALLDEHGAVQGEPTRIEVGEKDDATLAPELAAALQPGGRAAPPAIGVGHGKAARPSLLRLRKVIDQAGLETVALVVNEAGLSSYASSELARRELSELTVPQRMAVSLGRRLQDPLSEILKVEPRHLGLGAEQGLVSKANLRRTFDETIESCTAHVGCDVNRAPHSLLSRLPGLDAETATRIIARREERKIESREELRSEGLLTEAQWATAVAFLRVTGSPEPLDATSLHPEQYAMARKVIESTGGSVEDHLGKPGVTKGLRRTDFGVEEHVWRDLMRELWHPGRDPRPRLFRPELLDPAADAVTLTPGRVVDGVVSNVASFGAFVYVGLEHDAMVHVSEISKRYVRDARELVSIGQTIKARIKQAGGQSLSLSLKDMPETSREGGGRRRGGGGGGGERRGGGGRGAPRERREREPMVPIRAAQSRRDGLGGTGRGGRGRGGPGGGKGRGGRPGGGRDGRRRDRDEERVRPEELRSVSGGQTAYNPFASFFKKEPEEPKKTEGEASGAESSPVQE